MFPAILFCQRIIVAWDYGEFSELTLFRGLIEILRFGISLFGRTLVLLFTAFLFVIGSLQPFVYAQQDPVNPPPNQIELTEPPLPPELSPDIFLIEEFTQPYLWPRLWRRFKFRRSCGYIPPACRDIVDDPSGSIVDCWLENNPTIANSIKWEFTPGTPKPWARWSEDKKVDLRASFRAARSWKDSGFGEWPGNPVEDPPVNQDLPYLDESSLTTVLDSDTQAWPLFISQVAISLAAEIDCWIPWSLRNYHSTSLVEIFNGTNSRYTLDRDDGTGNDSTHHGHIVSDAVTPAHPANIWKFLNDEGIIADTARGTVSRLIEWSSENMLHSFGLHMPFGPPFLAFWQYHGLPPVIRMIEGTIVNDPAMGLYYPGVHSWTAGCLGTSSFFRAVLRVVNIPVRAVASERTCYHAMPYFPGLGVYLTHGDDPYSGYFKSGNYEGEELLVESDMWKRWFPKGDYDTACMNVGRRVVELNVSEPSGNLVRTYCSDQLEGLSRADSEVFDYVGRIYSMEELESMGFWEKLEMLAETSTSSECVTWREEMG